MNDASLIRSFDGSGGVFSKGVLLFLVIIILLGVGSGYLLANNKNGTGSSAGLSLGGLTNSSSKVVGSNDLKTFKDSAEGVLEDGGKEGEGQFHLVRPGGESQYVYMTSSLVDLSQFMKKKIKVWGQTQKAQKVGWLMDVGRVEVLQ